MTIQVLPHHLTVCKVASPADIDLTREFCFVGRTDEELSLVCLTEDVPACTIAREDGWRTFRIEGTLDFSLIGILAKLTGTLAQEGIGIFAVSTYNTDYILVREEQFEPALDALKKAGYDIARLK